MMRLSDYLHFFGALGGSVGLYWLIVGKPSGDTMVFMALIVMMGTTIRAIRSTQ